MKWQMVWSLTVSLLLVCGMIGCGAKPQPAVKVEAPEPVVDEPDVDEAEAAIEEAVAAQKAAMEEAVAAQKAAIDAAVAVQKECSQKLGSPVEITNSIGMKLALIPAGEFLMGSPESDPDLWETTWPQHKVRITKPFYLGVTEVTQWQYKQVTRLTPCPDRGNPDYPVENVSWQEAVEFCEKLSEKEGQLYRLPTEAEWEYTCRAGTTTKWYCGDTEEELGRVAWYGENGGMSHPVGAKEANAWGLFDMHGNVMEWCQDGWRSYSSDEAIDPTGPEDAPDRVIRGGSWSDSAGDCRAARRGRFAPLDQGSPLGFRVVAVPPTQLAKPKSKDRQAEPSA